MILCVRHMKELDVKLRCAMTDRPGAILACPACEAVKGGLANHIFVTDDVLEVMSQNGTILKVRNTAEGREATE